MKVQQPTLKRARIEIIPMIDAIFFLLVFFMFSSLSMVKFRGMRLALPTSAAAASRASAEKARLGPPGKLIVTVTAGGQFFLNRSPIQEAGLRQALQAALNMRPNSYIVVNVAKVQTTQSLINVMDSIQRVSPPLGQPLEVLIATEPIDLEGNAVGAPQKAPTTAGLAPPAMRP